MRWPGLKYQTFGSNQELGQLLQVCIFPRSGKGRRFHLHTRTYQHMGNNLFQSLHGKDTGFHLPWRKSRVANVVPVAPNAPSRTLWFSSPCPLGADTGTCTAKAALRRQLPLGNLTDASLFQRICWLLLAFQLHKNTDLKERKSSILWNTYCLSVYVFGNNADLSVHNIVSIAPTILAPTTQYTCELFIHNYYVAGVMVGTTKMTGF